MSAGTVAPLPEAKHVRVCFDGVARTLAHQPTLLRVEVGNRVVIVDTADKDVVVEYPEPARTWTDGDVVAREQCVWSRTAGTWHCVGPFGVQSAMDTDVDQMLANGTVHVVRYQRGEA